MPAVRAATALAVCLIVAERLHLQQPGLAVWSTHMVMVQYTFTTFQKGVERVLGRGAGILMALVLAALTRNAWGLGIGLELLAIVPLFYIYFSGRLSYTFLNAGLYLASVMEIARTRPTEVIRPKGKCRASKAHAAKAGVPEFVSKVVSLQRLTHNRNLDDHFLHRYPAVCGEP